ncbi:MAG: anti-sigma factor antagonist [Gammaproteobacteria bacterium]|nr:MAG: anti-sigma factor antagonist [Gammaproteobacteria bacterium]
MPVESTFSDNKETLTIKVLGNFDFNLHKEFRDAYAALQEPVTKCVIDMNETDYMDSSALGMLLILKDHASSVGAEVILANCKPDIKGILSVANFDDMFEIEE